MKLISEILIIFFVFTNVNASFSGPFLMWGYEKVKNMKIPALESVEEKTLTTVFSEAKAIIMFLKNGTNKLDNQNYPTLKELINKNYWAYLPQNSLPAEPVDYNSNVEIIPLVGPPSQQDVELAALYHDAVTIYGEGEVLGILANQADDIHMIYKRQAENEENLSTVSPPATVEEPIIIEDFTYISNDGKAMMYTTIAPELTLESESNDEKVVTKKLTKHTIVTFDHRVNAFGFFRMIIGFITDFGKVTLRFKFPVSGGYWSLTSVEVENSSSVVTTLNVVGDAPSAPIGFSYSCSKPLVFTNGTNILKFNTIQVQPAVPKPHRFSDAYNCIGFTTVPIWSGIFVSFIVITVTFIGILAILDIKSPNRFESNRNKQLSINVQD